MKRAQSTPAFSALGADKKLLNSADLQGSRLPTLRFDPRRHDYSGITRPRASSLVDVRTAAAAAAAGAAATPTSDDATSAPTAYGATTTTTTTSAPTPAPPPAEYGGSGAMSEGSEDGSDSSWRTAASERSVFDQALLARWDTALEDGLFRYDVTSCPTRTVEGRHGFVLQCNVGRAQKKRQTELSADRVCQDFDPAKFNFTKARQSELVFQFETCKMRTSPSMTAFDEKAEPVPARASPNCVLINVSPIEYGHVLLVPRILDCLPQRLDRDVIHLALHMAAESDNKHFRLGFNSLGAYATINHLHFQGYYLYQDFPVELAATRPVADCGNGVVISETVDYPVRLLVAETTTLRLAHLAGVLSSVCGRFQDQDQPFNILICDCGRRVFVVPQRFSRAVANGEVPQDVLDTQVNPAVFEICGHVVLKSDKDYLEFNEAKACHLLEQASLSEDDFGAVKAAIHRDVEAAAAASA